MFPREARLYPKVSGAACRLTSDRKETAVPQLSPRRQIISWVGSQRPQMIRPLSRVSTGQGITDRPWRSGEQMKRIAEIDLPSVCSTLGVGGFARNFPPVRRPSLDQGIFSQSDGQSLSTPVRPYRHNDTDPHGVPVFSHPTASLRQPARGPACRQRASRSVFCRRARPHTGRLRSCTSRASDRPQGASGLGRAVLRPP